MLDEPTPADCRADHALQHTLLELLHEPCPGIWHVSEIACAMGDPDLAAGAILALHAAGLVHSLDGYVFPTRPAVHYHRLERAVRP
jgi:hypothetical protein